MEINIDVCLCVCVYLLQSSTNWKKLEAVTYEKQQAT